ncbi:protein rep [Streptococcus suis]|uniref:protein rep n=4 Tax=Streptococcus suis TaxID=1307 RepID=UPI00188D5C36|nr:protein rep [Streptococcus suis]
MGKTDQHDDVKDVKTSASVQQAIADHFAHQRKQAEAELFAEDTDGKAENMKAYMRYKSLVEAGLIAMKPMRLEVIRTCAQLVKYAVDAERTTKKQLYVETCQDRFCARCQRRKAIRDGKCIMAVATGMVHLHNSRIIFMTLTIPSMADLKSGIADLNEGYRRLMQYEDITNVVQGSIAKLEATHNRKTGLFHPHLHVMLFVRPDYFDLRKSHYISTEKLLELWRRACQDDSITQVHLQAVKRDTNSIMAAVAELAKYVAKSADYTASDEVFLKYYEALKDAKLLRYAGECLPLVNAYSFDNYGIFDRLMKRKRPDAKQFVEKLLLNWYYKGKSYGVNVEELTEAERKRLEQKPRAKKDFVRDLNGAEKLLAKLIERHDHHKEKVAKMTAKKRKSDRSELEEARLELARKERDGWSRAKLQCTRKVEGLRLLGLIRGWLDEDGNLISKRGIEPKP